MPNVRKRFWEDHGDTMRMVSKYGDVILIDAEDLPLVEQYFISVSSKSVRIRQAVLSEKTAP